MRAEHVARSGFAGPRSAVERRGELARSGFAGPRSAAERGEELARSGFAGPRSAAERGEELIEEELAWELHSVHVPRRPSTWAPRIKAAIANGIIAGLLPSALVLVLYFLDNRDAPLPWVKIASILAVYGPAVGVSLAVLVEALVMITDRIARVGFGLVVVANPIVAATLGGLLAGIVPGAVGVVVFGSYHGPFVGTGLIAFGLIAGAVMVAVPLAIRARRARGNPPDTGVIAAATVFATTILCAVAAVIAPVIVGGAFAAAQSNVEEHGGIVGAVAGALGGGVVGVFIGIVIAFGRSLRQRAKEIDAFGRSLRQRERVPEIAGRRA